MKFQHLAALALLLGGFNVAVAQPTELDPVTITASLHPEFTSVTGRNIVVIKGDQFSKLPIHSIDELLRYVPGLEVQMRGAMGAQSDIVLRGGTFQQVLIIIDGLRLNDPNTGHFNSYIPIAPSEIDRIEILKGASSAIYGSEAVGGVINIITKTFAAKKATDKKQLIVQGSAGEYGLLNGQVGGLYQHNNTSLAGGVLSNNTNGQQQRGTKGFVHNNTASLSLNQYLNANWNVSFRSSFDNRNFSAQNFYTTFVSDTAREKVQTLWNQVRLGYEKENHNFSLQLGLKSVNDQFKYNSLSTANSNKSRLLQGLAIYNWQAGANTTYTGGMQWVTKIMRSNDRGNHSLNQAGAFLLVNQKLTSHLTVNPALRVEWNEISGWQLVPQGNVSYKVAHWQFRGSAGKTTRDADFTERFNNYNKAFVAGGSIGNPGLLPEKSFSYEAGADFFGLKNVKVAATFFQQHFKQLIDYTPTPYAAMPRKDNLSPTGSYALAKNIAAIDLTGFETDVQYSKVFSTTKQLWATAGVTFINNNNNGAAPSFYVSSHAKVLTNFSLQYQTKHYSVSMSGLYKERKALTAAAIHANITKNYLVMNLQAQAFVYRQKASVFVQADNLFNKTYSDLLGSVMPGRWISAGAKLAL